jgi:ketosteroid isomerase-like protein
MTTSATEPSPAEVFERAKEQLLAGGLHGDLLAEDVVVEVPFAPPGRPRRFAGRDEFLAFAAAGRAAVPLHLEECRNVVLHQTTDPNTIIVEYELTGGLIGSDRRGSAPFITVLRTRNGQITHWREYQNVLAMAAAAGQLPALLAGPSEDHQ